MAKIKTQKKRPYPTKQKPRHTQLIEDFIALEESR